jgi:beta-galactosidase
MAMRDVTEGPRREPPAALARRQFLRATAAGAAAMAGWSVLGGSRAPAAQAARAARSGQAAAHGPAALTTPFNTGWLFGPAATDSTDPGFDDSGLATVTLPHSVTPLSWRNWDPSSWGQSWVYRQHFDTPAQASGMRMFLDVAGAITSFTPVLNGQSLPSNVGGYLPFSVELTDNLSGSGEANVLAVTLESQFDFDVPPDRPAPYNPRSVDYWQPGGIYRDVNLRIVPQVFISDVFAQPVNVLTPAQRQIQVQVTLDAAVVPSGGVSIATQLLDGSTVVSTASAPVTISQAGPVTANVTLSGLADVTLWDIDNPKLYTVQVTLEVAGAPLHDYTVRTGLRDASFTADGFFLNGNRVKLIGLDRHQFFPFGGGAMSDRTQARDVAIMRQELNCNAVRCSHYPQSEAFYDAADELGLLCWEEMPGWGYFGDAAWQQAGYQDLHDMIVRDRNHPSIIVWGSMPNEAGEHVAEYTLYNELAHSLDPSRPTGGDGSRTDASFVFDVFSDHDYSSLTGPDGLKQPTLAAPTDAAGKPYLICEAIGTLSGPALAYRRTDSQQLQQGLASAHAMVHNISFSQDAYCGVIAWSGFDYESDATGNCFEGVKYTGVVDLFRALKPGAAFYQSQVAPAVRPVVQPAFYWTFGPDYPVTILPSAMICSNLDQLEVYVGGAHFATLTPDTTDYGSLPYPPFFTDFSGVDGASLPELRIDGYLNGTQVASRTFAADTSGDRLAVAADDAELTADGSDETRVEFRAVDSYGNPRPYVSGDVELAVTGPGVLIGDNPFAFADAGGVGAVWIRTLPFSAGVITVQVTHPTLGSGTATIQVVPPTPSGQPVPSGALTVQASQNVVLPGTVLELTAAFTNNGVVDLDQVTLAGQVPSGWTATATSSTTFAAVTSGQTVQASWQVNVPASTSPQNAAVTVTSVYTANARKERGVANASAQVLVPYPSLAAAFNNVGISADGSANSANFDGQGNSYSATALAAAGLTAGAVVKTPIGMQYAWPDVAVGQPDNVRGSGQTVLVSGQSGATTLGLLAACGNGSCYGTVIVHYTDGSSQYGLGYLTDWASGPGASGPDQGFSVAAVTAYRNKSTGVAAAGSFYVYEVTIALDPSRTVAAVTLPNRSGAASASQSVNSAHIFALSLGTQVVYPSLAAAFNNAGISDDSDVTGADFDGAGNSYSEQALTAAGLAPGATVTQDGLNFTWPNIPAGQPDNVIALGQTVGVSGTGTRLGFLGASSPSTALGTGLVHYADGTASEFTVRLDNYFAAPGIENNAVATLSYLNDSNPASNGGTAGQRQQTVYVFYASVPIIPGRQVTAVTLPPNGANPSGGRSQGMHIFALAVG